mgnify:CR=1 FL=1
MEKKLSVAMFGQKRLSREGGVEIVVKELCTRMAKAGHKVHFVLNPGMAFSLLSGKQLLLILATSAAMAVMAYWLFFRCRGKVLLQAALILMLGGGLGNLIDRVLNGAVVDYLNLLFMRFAVFNFADICVCVGAGLLVLYIFLDDLRASRSKDGSAQEQ